MPDTRLPHVHGALAEHFAHEPMDAADTRIALTLMQAGVYIADLPVDMWQSLRLSMPATDAPK
jgi:hypothetical protein